jgi:hypothetical protein
LHYRSVLHKTAVETVENGKTDVVLTVVQLAIHCAVWSLCGVHRGRSGGRRCFGTALALICQVPTWQINTISNVLSTKKIKMKYIFLLHSLKASGGMEV